MRRPTAPDRRGARDEGESIWASSLRVAAAVARQAASSEADVLRAVSAEMRRLKLLGTVTLLSPDGMLEVVSPSLSRSAQSTLQRISGLEIAHFRFDPKTVDVYREVLESREPRFTTERATMVRQLVPSAIRPLLPRIMHILGEYPVIVAPLLLADTPLGTINATAAWLTPEDMPMVAAFADHVAIALGHVRNRAEMQSALRRERLRHQVIETIASALDLNTVLERVLHLAVQVTEADAGAIGLLDPERKCLRFSYLFGLPDELGAQPSYPGQGLAWQVIARNSPIVVDDYIKEPEAQPAWIKAGVRALLGVPLASGDEVIGSMGLFSKRRGYRFQPEHSELVQGIAHMAAIAIQNARLYDQVTSRAEESQALIQTARSISASLDLQTVLNLIAEQVKTLLNSDGSRIHLYDPDGGVLRCVVVLHADADAVMAMPLTPGQGLTGTVFQTGQPLMVNNPADFPQAIHVPGTPVNEPEVMMMVPLQIRQRTIGVMTALRFSLEQPYGPRDLDLLSALAAHAAIAIENADLYGQIASQAHRLEAEVVERTRDLALSEARYRALVETSVAGIFQCDTDGLITYANQAFVAQTGRSAEEVVGASLVDLMPPEIRASAWTRFQERLRGERPPREVHELEMTRGQGRAFPALIAMSLVRDEEGKPRGVAGMVLDMSERKALEAALEAERDRLNTILANVGDAVVVTNVRGVIEYVNPAWERLTGYTAKEALGATNSVLRSGKNRPETYTELWGSILNGRPWRGELVNQRKDGSTYDAVVIITPMLDPAGNIANFVGVQYDISALKEIDRLKSQFVSDVSHELRTPLTNIRLYLDLMGATRDQSKAGGYLRTLSRESDRLAHLIDDLLSLSRLEAGATPFTPLPVDLNELITALAEDRRTLAAQRGLGLNLECAAGLPRAFGDQRLLSQVFTNLLTNAMNYTPQGGQVTLRTAVLTSGKEAWVTAEVQDTGPGIPPEEQPLLFRRFFRGQASHRTGAAGTGLGLAICKEIAELHGGRITVESDGIPGHGAIFTVWLPSAPAGRASPLPA